MNLVKSSPSFRSEETAFGKLPTFRWFAFFPKTENYSVRTGHTAALINKKIYLYGGVGSDGVSISNS